MSSEQLCDLYHCTSMWYNWSFELHLQLVFIVFSVILDPLSMSFAAQEPETEFYEDVQLWRLSKNV